MRHSLQTAALIVTMLHFGVGHAQDDVFSRETLTGTWLLGSAFTMSYSSRLEIAPESSSAGEAPLNEWDPELTWTYHEDRSDGQHHYFETTSYGETIPIHWVFQTEDSALIWRGSYYDNMYRARRVGATPTELLGDWLMASMSSYREFEKMVIEDGYVTLQGSYDSRLDLYPLMSDGTETITLGGAAVVSFQALDDGGFLVWIYNDYDYSSGVLYRIGQVPSWVTSAHR